MEREFTGNKKLSLRWFDSGLLVSCCKQKNQMISDTLQQALQLLGLNCPKSIPQESICKEWLLFCNICRAVPTSKIHFVPCMILWYFLKFKSRQTLHTDISCSFNSVFCSSFTNLFVGNYYPMPQKIEYISNLIISYLVYETHYKCAGLLTRDYWATGGLHMPAI